MLKEKDYFKIALHPIDICVSETPHCVMYGLRYFHAHLNYHSFFQSRFLYLFQNLNDLSLLKRALTRRAASAKILDL
jgi:hypothetical protein